MKYINTNNNTVLKIDETTGEVLDVLEEYTQPYSFNQLDPDSSKDGEQLRERCLSNKEKQTHEPFIGIMDYQDDLGVYFNPIIKLCSYIYNRNICFIYRDVLCNILSCSDSNLNRKLNQLQTKKYITFQTKNLNVKGQVKIVVNPNFYYKGHYTDYVEKCQESLWCLKEKETTVFDDSHLYSVTPSLTSENQEVKFIDYDKSFDTDYFVGCRLANKEKKVNKLFSMNSLQFIMFTQGL